METRIEKLEAKIKELEERIEVFEKIKRDEDEMIMAYVKREFGETSNT